MKKLFAGLFIAAAMLLGGAAMAETVDVTLDVEQYVSASFDTPADAVVTAANLGDATFDGTKSVPVNLNVFSNYAGDVAFAIAPAAGNPADIVWTIADGDAAQAFSQTGDSGTDIVCDVNISGLDTLDITAGEYSATLTATVTLDPLP